MPEPLADVDLDALAPAPKKVRLAGKVWKLPGDMPLELFFGLQTYEQRISQGASEVELLAEMRDELLALLQVHQPQLKKLPEIGLQTLILALQAIYQGGAAGEAPQNRAQRRSSPQRKRTSSAQTPPRPRARATSR